MRIRLASALFTVLAVTSGSPALAQIDTSTPEGQISQALLEVRLAHAADDIPGVLKHYWNDPRLVVIEPDEAFKLEGYGTVAGNSSKTGGPSRRRSSGARVTGR